MQIDEIEKILKDHETRIKKLESPIIILPTEAPVSNKVLSLPEFVVQKKPQDDLQRTLVFAYFLEKYEARDSFTAGDIQNCFLRAKASIPPNINDKINQCIKKGWISEHPKKTDSKKAFYLTSTGATFIESGLDKKP